MNNEPETIPKETVFLVVLIIISLIAIYIRATKDFTEESSPKNKTEKHLELI